MSINKVGKWELKEKLGKGGNGLVFRAEANGEDAAIKILRNQNRVGRFKDEIEGMRKLKGVTGVLPLIDAGVPESPSKNNPAWFAMPVAEPLINALGKHPTPGETICAVRDIATVLAEIHQNGFSHRDIKPDNLFRFEGNWSIGDFGLIEFEGKSHRTTLGEKIGPMHFIAPEMLLGIPGSDGKLADVFSLAKTLWVLLAGASFPIPGSYDALSGIYKLSSYVSLGRSVELDKLIQQCTAADPNDRPAMSEVVKELSAWTEIESGNRRNEGSDSNELSGAEWHNVLEAAQSQKLARTKHNALHSETNAAIEKMLNELKLFYSDVIADLDSRGLEVEGIQGTSPPGITIRFPQRPLQVGRLEMDFRVWLSANWGDLSKRKIKGTALCRMKLLGEDAVKELYKFEDEFVIDGPNGMKFIESVKGDAKKLFKSWLKTCAEAWTLLP